MFNRSRWSKQVLILGLVAFAVFLASANTEVGEASRLLATSPSLGAAETFAVLAGAGISDVPTSRITGDVGNPAGASITGLTCAEMVGTSKIYDSDNGFSGACHVQDSTLMTNALNASTAAFNALNTGPNATCTTNYGDVVTSLDGLSLPPGVYCTDDGTTGAFTLSKTLTLTGSGVWIFRSGSKLTTFPNAKIVGGDPCNVWWRVPGDQAGAATLGTNTSFIGNILTLKGIAMQTGASLTGRLLAQDAGAITLDSNTITLPICGASSPTPTNTPRPTIPTSTSTPLPATRTAVAATQTLTALIQTATAIALTPTQTRRPGGGGGGGGQATSVPTVILASTETPTATLPAVLPTTGGSGSDGLAPLWFALAVAGAALFGFPLLLRRRGQRNDH